MECKIGYNIRRSWEVTGCNKNEYRHSGQHGCRQGAADGRFRVSDQASGSRQKNLYIYKSGCRGVPHGGVPLVFSKANSCFYRKIEILRITKKGLLMKGKNSKQNLPVKRIVKRKDILKTGSMKNRTPKDLREHHRKGDDVLYDIIADIIRAL